MSRHAHHAQQAHRARKRKPLHRPPPGSSPGTLTVDPEAPQSAIRLFVYSAGSIEERKQASVADCLAARAPGRVIWADVAGLGDARTLAALAEGFGLHPLAMEDVVHVDQRPKAEVYGELLFVVLRTLNPDTDANEQLSMFLGAGLLITFQERAGDCFDPVRERLQRGGRIRRSGADYLAYALLDAAVDAQRPILERLQEELDGLEGGLLDGSLRDPIPELHRLRQRFQSIRRDVTPVREVLVALTRDEAELFTSETKIFLRDCQDHVAALLDGLDSGRDLVNSLVDMSVSLMSRKLNEMMRTLTIITTVFIPLSFIAGVYGMNFDPSSSAWNMPELSQPWGYPAALMLMAAVTVGMVIWFWRRGWLEPHAGRAAQAARPPGGAPAGGPSRTGAPEARHPQQSSSAPGRSGDPTPGRS